MALRSKVAKPRVVQAQAGDDLAGQSLGLHRMWQRVLSKEVA
jgi:hypothetical protein